MEHASVDGVDLEYEIRGTGEPVVLIHAGVLADWFAPLLGQPAITGAFRTLSYHRPGYGGSAGIAGPLDIARQAALCHGLMRHVGIERAHLVGHSSSAAMALQLALDAPEAVKTLTLMDAARPAPQTPTQAAFARTFAQPAIQRYRAGDTTAAVDTFLGGVFGTNYRPALDRGLPGAFQQAVL